MQQLSKLANPKTVIEKLIEETSDRQFFYCVQHFIKLVKVYLTIWYDRLSELRV